MLSPFCDTYEGHRVRVEVHGPGSGAMISRDDPFPDDLSSRVFLDDPSAYSAAESTWVVDCSEDDDIMFQHMSADSRDWLWAAGRGARVSTKTIAGHDVPVSGNTEWAARMLEAPAGSARRGVWQLSSASNAGTLYATNGCGLGRVLTGPEASAPGNVTRFHVQLID